MLWFSSQRVEGRDRLFAAPWDAATTSFGAPVMVTLGSTDSDDQHPYYRAAGGGELWFTSNRGGQWEIYVAKKNVVGFGPPVRVEELRSSAVSRQPMLTEDGLTIVFSTKRDGGLGGSDLWMATRSVATAAFSAPLPLTNLNSTADEYAGWISKDGCRLYFSSDRAAGGTHRIYVATRPAS